MDNSGGTPNRPATAEGSATAAGDSAPETGAQPREVRVETDLLDRLERQVVELTELRAHVKNLERAVAAERKTRAEMAERLSAERDRVKQLAADIQSMNGDDVDELRQELARERQSAVALGSLLEQAWTELNDARAGGARGRFRRAKS